MNVIHTTLDGATVCRGVRIGALCTGSVDTPHGGPCRAMSLLYFARVRMECRHHIVNVHGNDGVISMQQLRTEGLAVLYHEYGPLDLLRPSN